MAENGEGIEGEVHIEENTQVAEGHRQEVVQKTGSPGHRCLCYQLSPESRDPFDWSVFFNYIFLFFLFFSSFSFSFFLSLFFNHPPLSVRIRYHFHFSSFEEENNNFSEWYISNFSLHFINRFSSSVLAYPE